MHLLSLFHLQRPRATTPAPAPTPRSPATILLGKYELGRRLGSGNFAKVHVARSIKDDELVAIKIIDKKKTVGIEERIIREIEAMRRLQDHPNILKIHEVMGTKSKIYLVVELAVGGELFTKLMHSRRLGESAARRYFQQLASALTFCHREGIVHRDVKPQNLLLDRVGNLKLSDFGLTALSENRNSDGLLRTVCGTPAYTAPEVISQRNYDGVKADAWSCGVFLFVLLAGYLPFNDSNIVVMYRKIQRRDYRFPSSISKPARTIIFKLLDPNPKTRMSLETVMKTTWFQKSLDISSEFHSTVFQADDDRLAKPSNDMITAFDLMISLAPGLDISGIFERKKRKEKRFTARVSAEGVVEKARMVGEKLGYRVEKKTEVTVVGLRKGRTAVVVEAVELAEGFVVGEVKVVEGDEEDEKEESHWLELIVELEEIVLTWHCDVI